MYIITISRNLQYWLWTRNNKQELGYLYPLFSFLQVSYNLCLYVHMSINLSLPPNAPFSIPAPILPTTLRRTFIFTLGGSEGFLDHGPVVHYVWLTKHVHNIWSCHCCRFLPLAICGTIGPLLGGSQGEEAINEYIDNNENNNYSCCYCYFLILLALSHVRWHLRKECKNQNKIDHSASVQLHRKYKDPVEGVPSPLTWSLLDISSYAGNIEKYLLKLHVFRDDSNNMNN